MKEPQLELVPQETTLDRLKKLRETLTKMNVKLAEHAKEKRGQE